MLESELKYLPVKDLLEIADKAMNLYIAASVDPEHRLLAQQRQADLFLLNKIITEKRANNKSLK